MIDLRADAYNEDIKVAVQHLTLSVLSVQGIQSIPCTVTFIIMML